MIDIRFDRFGNVKKTVNALSAGDTLPVNLISNDEEIDDTADAELTLSVRQPEIISGGVTTITFGANSVDIESDKMTAYGVSIAINSLASVISAGGVVATPRGNAVHVRFIEVGARDPFTISHSSTGVMTGRCITLDAGGVSDAASFLLDFSIDVLAETTAKSNITAAAVSIATTVTGDGSTNQVQTLTLTRTPDSGKFQLWVGGDSTAWLNPDASAYEIYTALNDIRENEFIVDRQELGEKLVWTITRKDVGALDLLTVSETLIGPAGISMTLDLSSVLEVLAMTDLESAGDCVLTFKYDDLTRFSHPIDMRPILSRHAALA